MVVLQPEISDAFARRLLRVLRVTRAEPIRDAFVRRSARVRSRAELYAPSSGELG